MRFSFFASPSTYNIQYNVLSKHKNEERILPWLCSNGGALSDLSSGARKLRI
jgi:hypothetical protein